MSSFQKTDSYLSALLKWFFLLFFQHKRLKKLISVDPGRNGWSGSWESREQAACPTDHRNSFHDPAPGIRFRPRGRFRPRIGSQPPCNPFPGQDPLHVCCFLAPARRRDARSAADGSRADVELVADRRPRGGTPGLLACGPLADPPRPAGAARPDLAAGDRKSVE